MKEVEKGDDDNEGAGVEGGGLLVGGWNYRRRGALWMLFAFNMSLICLAGPQQIKLLTNPTRMHVISTHAAYRHLFVPRFCFPGQ